MSLLLRIDGRTFYDKKRLSNDRLRSKLHGLTVRMSELLPVRTVYRVRTNKLMVWWYLIVHRSYIERLSLLSPVQLSEILNISIIVEIWNRKFSFKTHRFAYLRWTKLQKTFFSKKSRWRFLKCVANRRWVKSRCSFNFRSLKKFKSNLK